MPTPMSAAAQEQGNQKMLYDSTLEKILKMTILRIKVDSLIVI